MILASLSLMLLAASSAAAASVPLGQVLGAIEGEKEFLHLTVEYPKQQVSNSQLGVEGIFGSKTYSYEAPDGVVILRPQRNASPNFVHWAAEDTETGRNQFYLVHSAGHGGHGHSNYVSTHDPKEGAGAVTVLELRKTYKTVLFEKGEFNYGVGHVRTIIKPVVQGLIAKARKLFACKHTDIHGSSAWILRFGFDFQLFDPTGQKCRSVTLMVNVPIPLLTKKAPTKSMMMVPTSDDIRSKLKHERPQTPKGQRVPVKMERSDSDSHSISTNSRDGSSMTVREPLFPEPMKKVKFNFGACDNISPNAETPAKKNAKEPDFKYAKPHAPRGPNREAAVEHSRGRGREYERIDAIRAVDDECAKALRGETNPQYVITSREIVEAARTTGVATPGIRLVWLFTLQNIQNEREILQCEGPTLYNLLARVPQVGDWVESFWMQETQRNIRRTKGWGSIVLREKEMLRRVHLVNGLWTLRNSVVLGQVAKSYRVHNLETGYSASFNDEILKFMGLSSLANDFDPIEQDLASASDDDAARVLRSFFRMEWDDDAAEVENWDALPFRIERVVPEISSPDSSYYYKLPDPWERHIPWSPVLVFCSKQHVEKKRCMAVQRSNRGRLRGVFRLISEHLDDRRTILRMDKMKLPVQERISKLQAMVRARFGGIQAGELRHQEETDQLLAEFKRVEDRDSEEVTHEDDDDLEGFQIQKRPIMKVDQGMQKEIDEDVLQEVNEMAYLSSLTKQEEQPVDIGVLVKSEDNGMDADNLKAHDDEGEEVVMISRRHKNKKQIN